MRDEILVAKKRIDDETRVRKEDGDGDGDGDILTRTSSHQGREERSGTPGPAPKPPSQVPVRPGVRKGLERMGAIADISVLATSPSQQSAQSAQCDDDNFCHPKR